MIRWSFIFLAPSSPFPKAYQSPTRFCCKNLGPHTQSTCTLFAFHLWSSISLTHVSLTRCLFAAWLEPWLLFSTQTFPPGPCPAENTSFSLLFGTTCTPCKTHRANVTHSMGFFPIPHITRRQMHLHKWGGLLRIRLTTIKNPNNIYVVCIYINTFVVILLYTRIAR